MTVAEPVVPEEACRRTMSVTGRVSMRAGVGAAQVILGGEGEPRDVGGGSDRLGAYSRFGEAVAIKFGLGGTFESGCKTRF